MVRVIVARLAAIVTLTVLAFGAVSVAATPSTAQVMVRCWKQTCWTGSDGRLVCRVDEIPCPNES
jgi:hypothetical protein